MKAICAGVGFGSGTETRRSRDTLYSVSPSCASSWRPTGQNLWFYTKFVLCLYIHYQLCYILANLYSGNESICIWYLVSILFWPAHHYKISIKCAYESVGYFQLSCDCALQPICPCFYTHTPPTSSLSVPQVMLRACSLEMRPWLYSRTSIMWTPSKVSWVKRCPYFGGFECISDRCGDAYSCRWAPM